MNDNRTLADEIRASLAAMPPRTVPGNSASLATRRTFRDELPTERTRHAWRYPETLQTIGQPSRWIEPSLSREDAISEARRIAEEVSIFGTGFAWEHLGHWYAADVKPMSDDAHGLGFGEIVTVEIGVGETSRNARGLW